MEQQWVDLIWTAVWIIATLAGVALLVWAVMVFVVLRFIRGTHKRIEREWDRW